MTLEQFLTIDHAAQAAFCAYLAKETAKGWAETFKPGAWFSLDAQRRHGWRLAVAQVLTLIRDGEADPPILAQTLFQVYQRHNGQRSVQVWGDTVVNQAAWGAGASYLYETQIRLLIEG